MYPFRKRKVESTWHGVWGCRVLKIVRKDWPAVVDMGGNFDSNFLDFMTACLEPVIVETDAEVVAKWIVEGTKLYSEDGVVKFRGSLLDSGKPSMRESDCAG
ncbi:hypothetical protein QYF36_005988 [Acer negundo]|nr:hypothetical protein QYF36_005988 [Acer negundo]